MKRGVVLAVGAVVVVIWCCGCMVMKVDEDGGMVVDDGDGDAVEESGGGEKERELRWVKILGFLKRERREIKRK